MGSHGWLTVNVHFTRPEYNTHAYRLSLTLFWEDTVDTVAKKYQVSGPWTNHLTKEQSLTEVEAWCCCGTTCTIH